MHIVVNAYRRRRGWAAWHGAYLHRVDVKHFPELAEMTGEPQHKTEQTQDEFEQSIALWRMAIKQKDGAGHE